jgi:hypothetical protein
LKYTKQMLNLVFGGCPKRKVCGFFQTESKTCVFGPYRYCGKYRSIVEPKSKMKMTNEQQSKVADLRG